MLSTHVCGWLFFEFQKFSYPESPTNPLQSFRDGDYLGRMGSFTVPPFRAVDEIPRWVPLWFPAGGKAHAYNILGGKRSVLGFEMSRDNQQKINEIKKEVEELKITTSSLQDEIASVGLKLAAKTELKSQLDDKISSMTLILETLKGTEEEINTLKVTLQANPALASVLEVQIKSRQNKIHELYREMASELFPSKEKNAGIEELRFEKSLTRNNKFSHS